MTKHKIELAIMDAFLNKDITFDEKECLLNVTNALENDGETLNKHYLLVSNKELLRASFDHFDKCLEQGLSCEEAHEEWWNIVGNKLKKEEL